MVSPWDCDWVIMGTWDGSATADLCGGSHGYWAKAMTEHVWVSALAGYSCASR